MVYLADDPDEGRRVVVKTLRMRPAGDEPAPLPDSHAVRRLHHPHIVPVYEVGEHAGSPYVVYAYIEGRTLRDRLRGAGPLPAGEAIRYTLPLLDAVEYAHAQGIVHGDLNPSNVRIDEDDVPRVMDFGIAELAGAGRQAATGIGGTAGYLAPEQLSGDPVGPAADLFSVGLILYEMLTGTRAIRATDSVAAMVQIAHQPIDPPSRRKAGIDPRVEQVVLRALEKRPEDRYASAAEMREALAGIDQPGDADVVQHGSKVSFLLRRMRRNRDFLAISGSIAALLRSATSGARAVTAGVANAILDDPALAERVLALVNAPVLRRCDEPVGTVSRALLDRGREPLSMTTLALLLHARIDGRPRAPQLRDLAARAFLRGVIGRELARLAPDCGAEEAFACAMLGDLGRYLTIGFLPGEYGEIRRAMRVQELDEETACRSVLGLGYEEIALAVAREWRLPDLVVDCMRALPDGPVEPPRHRGELLHQLVVCADALCAAMLDGDPDRGKATVDATVQRFSGSVTAQLADAQAMLSQAVRAASGCAALVHPCLLATPSMEAAISFTGVTRVPAGDSPAARGRPDRAAIVADGVRDANALQQDGSPLVDVLTTILETMLRGLGLARVAFCVVEPAERQLVARFGLGRDVDRLVARFRCPLDAADDGFAAAVRDRADRVHPSEEFASADIPAWFRAMSAPRALAILPLVVRDACVGAIYCELDRADRQVSPETLRQLQSLRDLAVAAIGKRRQP